MVGDGESPGTSRKNKSEHEERWAKRATSGGEVFAKRIKEGLTKEQRGVALQVRAWTSTTSTLSERLESFR